MGIINLQASYSISSDSPVVYEYVRVDICERWDLICARPGTYERTYNHNLPAMQVQVAVLHGDPKHAKIAQLYAPMQFYA